MLQHAVNMSGNGFQQRVGTLRVSALQRAIARNQSRRARDDSTSKHFEKNKIVFFDNRNFDGFTIFLYF